jgi:hypothetical protein
MKRSVFATVLPVVAFVAGCGGGGSSAGSSNSSQSLKLSGWYQCLPAGTPSPSSLIQNSTPSVLVTPHGAFYGQCSDGYLYANLSGNYSGSVGVLAGFTDEVVTATLTNVQFYDPKTDLLATNMDGTLLSTDAYTSVPASVSLNSNGTISFNESGSTSKEGAPALFVIPTTLDLVGPNAPGALSSAPTSNGYTPPATAGGYAGEYVGVPLPFTQWGVVSTTSLTIDSSGNVTATTAVGSLTGTVSAYDSTTGTAEYTGTLATPTGQIPVQGAYSLNYYHVTEANLTAGGSGSITYGPLALFVKGSGFQYELLVVPAN